MFNPLPRIHAADTLQIGIFITFFFLSSGSIINGWLSVCYLLNNAFLLLLCLLTIIYPLSVKLHYIFAYALPVSFVLDIMVTIYNWPYYGGFRWFPFVLQIIYLVLKVCVAIFEIQTAKTLNDEPRLPITFGGAMFDLTNSQTIQAPAQHQHQQRPSPRPPPPAPMTPSATTSHVNETLPPYQAAASSVGRSDKEKPSSYQDAGYPATVHSTTITTTTTTQNMSDQITASNVDDL